LNFASLWDTLFARMMFAGTSGKWKSRDINPTLQIVDYESVGFVRSVQQQLVFVMEEYLTSRSKSDSTA
jgi:hypothetical protein